MLPVLHKLFAFTVLSPLTRRVRPIRILPPGPPLRASASHDALTLALDRDNELLLRSGLQSAGSDIRGRDKLLLNWRMPLACVAAGLVNLQRFRSERPDHLTVTAALEHFEVALINIPAGGAVVLQPRALVGVLKPRNAKLRITRPGRLDHLLAWLTFRFRFIPFHGPCSLVVQGRGGVAVDHAGRGRTIDRRLVLGFEAGATLGAARTASFLPYRRGEKGLFVDHFTSDGCFVHGQRPSVAGGGNVWGRGLKGLSDAALGALGI